VAAAQLEEHANFFVNVCNSIEDYIHAPMAAGQHLGVEDIHRKRGQTWEDVLENFIQADQAV
jgi:hypothetical protein